MPRIAADSVAEHVAQQRASVLDAAIRLFTTNGYQEVTLGDIAAEVGLARNSLYRYVPDKAHLLVEWYRQAVPRIIASWRSAIDGESAVGEDGTNPDAASGRLQRWAGAYLAWASSPEHRLVAPLTESLDGLDDDTRAEVAALHRSMMDVVAELVREAGVEDSQVAGTVELLAGLVLGAARAEAAHGPDPATRHRLDEAITAIIDADANAGESRRPG